LTGKSAVSLSVGLIGSIAVAGAALAHAVPEHQRRALADGGHFDYAWSGAVHMLTATTTCSSCPA